MVTVVEVTAVEYFTSSATRQTYAVGQTFNVARDVAVPLVLRGFVSTEARFTRAELLAGARDVLAGLEDDRRNRGMDEEAFGRVPRVRATLGRIAEALGVDGPDGPGKVAA